MSSKRGGVARKKTRKEKNENQNHQTHEKTDPLPVVRKLLLLQREHNKWRREIESSAHVTLDDPIGGKLLYHLALDLLGVTPENLEEVEDFYVLMVTPTDRNSIDGFIDLVTGKQVLPGNKQRFRIGGSARPREFRCSASQASRVACRSLPTNRIASSQRFSDLEVRKFNQKALSDKKR